MKAERLIELFERVGEAPGAVERFRDLVLRLAIRGRLTNEDACRGIRREGDCDSSPHGDLTEADLPAGWRLVSLDSLGVIRGGGTPSKSNAEYWNGDVPWVSPKDMKSDYLTDSGLHVSQLATQETPARILPPGCVLFVVRGMILAHSFPVALTRVSVTINQDIKALELFDWRLGEFVLLALNGLRDRVLARVQRSSHGTCRLDGDSYRELRVPVPPPDEQRRIVACVHELMALCDQLESAQAERERRRNRLVAASLQRLREPVEDRAVFREHAAFHLRHMGRMTTQVEHVREMREAVLAMAVRGGLNVRRPIDQDYVRLGDLATLQNGYAFKSEWFSRRGVRLLRNINVTPNRIRWEDVACIDADRAKDFERFALKVGDIVLSLDRPFVAAGTKVARISPSDGCCLLLQRVGRFGFASNRLDDDFVFLWLRSSAFSSQLNPGRSNGVPHVSSREVEDTLIWLPSMQEQRATVRRANELLALCDQLERALVLDAKSRVALLDITIRSALSAMK